MQSSLQNFLSNIIQPRLNDPRDPKFWLPGLLQNMRRIDGDPLLPLYEDGAAAVTMSSEHAGLVSRSIVAAWEQTSAKHAIVYPGSEAPVLSLSNLSVTGLQNLALDRMSCTSRPGGRGYTCSIGLRLNHYRSLPSVSINGRYMLQQDFCTCSDAGRTQCDTERRTITVTGGFTANLGPCLLTAQIDVDVAGAGEARCIVASVKSLALGGEEPERSPSLAVSEVTVNGLQQWILGSIEDALNRPEAKGAILGVIAASLNQPDNLAAIGEMLSSALAAALDSVFPAAQPQCIADASVRSACK